jgi:peptidoglycan LD-endopeptidase CwlK
MPFSLDAASEKKLVGVHPHLVAVVRRAAELCEQPFIVFEGVRTIEREREMIARGTSGLHNARACRHVPKVSASAGGASVSHAVDLVPLVGGRPQWSWPHIPPIVKAMKQAAAELKTPLECGAEWPRFKDGPHYQLPWAAYP